MLVTSRLSMVAWLVRSLTHPLPTGSKLAGHEEIHLMEFVATEAMHSFSFVPKGGAKLNSSTTMSTCSCARSLPTTSHWLCSFPLHHHSYSLLANCYPSYALNCSTCLSVLSKCLLFCIAMMLKKYPAFRWFEFINFLLKHDKQRHGRELMLNTKEWLIHVNCLELFLRLMLWKEIENNHNFAGHHSASS